MRFMILMSDDPSWDALSSEAQAAVFAEHERFESELRASGAFVSSERFEPGTGGAVERDAHGATLRAANPEQGRGAIGGYYLVDVADLDAALGWAERGRFIAGTNWVYPVAEE